VIASTLFHAGADLMVINGFIAAFHKEESEKHLLERLGERLENWTILSVYNSSASRVPMNSLHRSADSVGQVQVIIQRRGS